MMYLQYNLNSTEKVLLLTVLEESDEEIQVVRPEIPEIPKSTIPKAVNKKRLASRVPLPNRRPPTRVPRKVPETKVEPPIAPTQRLSTEKLPTELPPAKPVHKEPPKISVRPVLGEKRSQKELLPKRESLRYRRPQTQREVPRRTPRRYEEIEVEEEEDEEEEEEEYLEEEEEQIPEYRQRLRGVLSRILSKAR
jgi:hypothetical protein